MAPVVNLGAGITDSVVSVGEIFIQFELNHVGAL